MTTSLSQSWCSIDFAYNNTLHSLITMTLLLVNHGFHLCFHVDILASFINPFTKERILIIDKVDHNLAVKLIHTQERHTNQLDN